MEIVSAQVSLLHSQSAVTRGTSSLPATSAIRSFTSRKSDSFLAARSALDSTGESLAGAARRPSGERGARRGPSALADPDTGRLARALELGHVGERDDERQAAAALRVGPVGES